jgi:hypothetical protein
MVKIADVKHIILRNEGRIKSHNAFVFERAKSIFSSTQIDDFKRQESLGLDVIVSGKSLLTALTSHEQDLELYKDTKSQFKGSDSKSIQTSIQTGMILASSNNDNLLNVDSRIVASKQILIQKTDEYNLKVKYYHQGSPFKWNDPIEFISL